MKKQDRGPAASSDFQGELADLLNRHCMENDSNTPDFILARYMQCCLEAFDEGVRRRDVWYHGKMMEPGSGATAGSASASEPPASQDLTNPAAASEKEGAP